MPQQVTVLRVFISSPSDVAEERDIVEDLIDDHNKTWGPSRGIVLQLLRWERDVVPGFGEYPQDVANQQIDDQYDVFIGIIWARFGTATPKAGSGTEEEFDRAYERFVSDPNSIKILLYFSDRPIVAKHQDIDQLKLVSDFRKKATDKGGLYHAYDSLDDFRNLVRIHLAKVVQEWEVVSGHRPKDGTLPNGGTNLPGSGGAEPPDEDEEGLLDLVERGMDSMREVGAIAEEISESIVKLGDRMTERTAEIKAANPKDTRLAKLFVDRAADDILSFVESVEDKVPAFSQRYENALDAFGRAALLIHGVNPDDAAFVSNARSGAEKLAPALQESRASLIGLRSSIASLPPMSTKLNRAKAKAVAILDALDDAWGRALDLSVSFGETLGLASPNQ